MHYLILVITGIVAFISQIMTRSVSVFLEAMSRKILVIGAVLGVLASMVTAFYLLIMGIISSISLLAPPMINQAASLVIPDNFTVLVSIKITAQLARFAYEWNVKVLQWRL